MCIYSSYSYPLSHNLTNTNTFFTSELTITLHPGTTGDININEIGKFSSKDATSLISTLGVEPQTHNIKVYKYNL
jgi:hypothetical protein